MPSCATKRVRTQCRNILNVGFHTRLTPCLPWGVEVLFQTGNTLGIVPLTTTEFGCLSAPNHLWKPQNLRQDFGLVCVATTLSFLILKERQMTYPTSSVCKLNHSFSNRNTFPTPNPPAPHFPRPFAIYTAPTNTSPHSFSTGLPPGLLISQIDRGRTGRKSPFPNWGLNVKPI